MLNSRTTKHSGFSLVELVVSMAITLVILGVAITVFSTAMGRRARETSRTDAITSAQAALNIMSREIGNAGYGLTNNGVVSDSTATKLHIRANLVNSNATTSDPGEDIVFYLDGTGGDQSVVRRDNNTGEISGIINRISSVNFVYQNYANPGEVVPVGVPGEATGRVTITLTVNLENIPGQVAGQTVTVTSDVTLRNSAYMRGQY